MKEIMIRLNTIKDVKKFVGVAESCPFPIDLSSGRYTVDGKSLMGIFSLDLTEPIKLIAHGDDKKLLAELEEFKA